MTRKEQRLSALLAQRDGIKSRTNKEFANIQKTVKKAEMFQGLTKTYEKKDEDGDDFPPQAVRVRARVADLLDSVRDLATDQFNAEASVDRGNQTATANVEVNGATLLSDVPVVTLLALERDLKQIREFVTHLPTLDPTFDWKLDVAAGVYKTDELRTNRQVKSKKPIVLYDATDNHPAQTQLISEDRVVGEWVTVQSSGAIPSDERKKIIKRCDTLLDAIKTAREEANSIKVQPVDIGSPVFAYLFGE